MSPSTVNEHHPVIIVGCGPVGLTVATNLARLGVPVLVLERNPGVDQSPRASAYQPCAQAELLETGTLDDVKKEAVINDRLSYWIDKKRVAYVEKREGGQVFPAGINCPQPQLAAILLKHLTTRYHSQVKFNQNVIEITQHDDQVSVTALDATTDQKTQYTCDWLVGTDGAGSGVRKLSDIAFEGFSWPKEDFVATNIRYDFYQHGFSTANFVLDPVNWAVVTILGAEKDLWRIAFGVRAGLTNEEIKAELDEHYKEIFPVWPVKYELVQLNKYKPHQRCAKTFRKGRVLLAGDAAHSNNPIGGLGLTTGLLDAGPLGRALAAVIQGRAPESLLDTWATARREKWLSFTNEFSIENKRLMQRAGYSDDPLGIWKIDDVAREHQMEQWLAKATPEKKDADLKFFKALEDPQAQLMSRMKQWEITMDPMWMAQYEDPEVVKYRVSLRPTALSTNTLMG
ncbi:FAD binding domain-containing protein [Exophiala viscosa]|uniref:FAD binding domain-containing protein n=1 Tax=Exophiala viscosa TaxID=2486360 RepID=UPI002191D4BF|nr:FAD binding domain-containing protein [Exophiala viscosa]